jgi:fatty acid desaturase
MTTETPAIENVTEPHEPHWVSRAAFQMIVFALLVIQVALGVALHRGLIWLAVPLVLVASHLMHGLLIGFHEASHGLLRTNRRFNDFDGILIGVFSFLPFSLYRAVHQTHHAHLAAERDEELWPFVVPGMPRWARRLAAFSELTAGLVYSPILFLRSFLRAGSPVRSKKVRRRIWAEIGLTVVVWMGILSAVAWWHAWSYLLWMYLAPAVLAANSQSWRKYIEHVGLTGSTVNGCTRSIVSKGPLGRLVALTLLHEPYHGVHHRHAGLPHAELPQLAAELRPTSPGERSPYPSYRRALLDLLRSLADPRVGAQWRTAKPAQA